jgi:flagellar motility protein MotE (MotC chaperone)
MEFSRGSLQLTVNSFGEEKGKGFTTEETEGPQKERRNGEAISPQRTRRAQRKERGRKEKDNAEVAEDTEFAEEKRREEKRREEKADPSTPAKCTGRPGKNNRDAEYAHKARCGPDAPHFGAEEKIGPLRLPAAGRVGMTK